MQHDRVFAAKTKLGDQRAVSARQVVVFPGKCTLETHRGSRGASELRVGDVVVFGDGIRRCVELVRKIEHVTVTRVPSVASLRNTIQYTRYSTVRFEDKRHVEYTYEVTFLVEASWLNPTYAESWDDKLLKFPGGLDESAVEARIKNDFEVTFLSCRKPKKIENDMKSSISGARVTRV